MIVAWQFFTSQYEIVTKIISIKQLIDPHVAYGSMMAIFEREVTTRICWVLQSCFPCLQVGATEDLISPDTVDAVHAGAPGAGLFQPVDIRIPVGPIFNFVSGKSENKKWCFHPLASQE